MIQEKDFLYRVPVKTAPITTPGGQIRNPEILVDIEGGEFMHGNILDANSTNKLINQSVKDAVDNKLIESGYVTKDLLEAETTRATEQENSLKTLIGAETSARTKGDEDLNSKIKAEQTRAEGKEKEISDKLAIVNGDSNTEGSFRKAIADVVAAAPEDLDTLKEIADKLAGNDDLHTALNQAITEKADTSALLNEVTRATGVENDLKATLVNYALNSDVEEKLAQKADTTMLSEFIDRTSTEEQAINSPLHAKEYISVFHNTADGASGIKITNSGILAIDQLNENASPNKVFATDGSIADLSQYADATALSNYVLTTALNQQVDTLNTAISAKQDAGNYIPYESINNKIYVTKHGEGISFESDSGNASIKGSVIVVGNTNGHIAVTPSFIWLKGHNDNGEGTDTPLFELNEDGLRLRNGDNNHVLTSNASTIDITEYAKKSEIAPLPTNIVTASAVSDRYFGFEKSIEIYSEAINKIMTIGYTGINFKTNKNDVAINEDGFFISSDSDDTDLCSFTTSGIKFAGKTSTDIPTANGTFINITEQIDHAVNDYNFISQQQADSRYALADTFSSLSAGLSAKQNKITVNNVDVTDIETADAEKLRTIVTNLTNALSESGLIRLVENVE